MERERFTKVVEQVLDSLPEQFRERIHNLAIMVEDRPPKSMSPKRGMSEGMYDMALQVLCAR